MAEPIETVLFDRGRADRPRIIAVFSYRYDAHLVPGLIENIRPIVDGYVAWDDRGAEAALSDEPARRAALLRAALEAGAQWILAIDPDERIEDRVARKIRWMTRRGRRCIWEFPLREMYGPRVYRADGIWGIKTQARLFPADIAVSPSEAAFHGAWFPADHGLRVRTSPIQIFHLRMAHEVRRRHRWLTYAASDPERRFQALGYDYMIDEADRRLVRLGEEERYSPPFVEDGGLWAPDASALPGEAPRDPVEAVLCRAEIHARLGDAGTVARLLGDVAGAEPGGGLFAAAAARWARWAGEVDWDGESWRRWCSPGATCRDGPDRTGGPLAVVVLSYRAPGHVRAAVASLLVQEPRPEVVVVNSGGGDIGEVLGPLAAQVRYIAEPGRLRVGAARNVGIDGSRAPVIAFLAADCAAEPGWVAARLARHRAGERAVATPVVPAAPERAASLVQWLLLHGTRTPGRPEAEAQRYGVSYDRALFDRHGYFLPGRQEGEDTEFNRRIGGIGWCPAARTRHRYVTTVGALVLDTMRRGFRGGRSLPVKLRVFRAGLRGSVWRIRRRSRFMRRMMRGALVRGEAPGWSWRHRALWEGALVLQVLGLVLGELSLRLRPLPAARAEDLPPEVVLRVAPADVESRRAAVARHLAHGDRAAARALAEDGVLRAPWDPACHRLLADVAEREGDHDMADRRRTMAEALSGRGL